MTNPNVRTLTEILSRPQRWLAALLLVGLAWGGGLTGQAEERSVTPPGEAHATLHVTEGLVAELIAAEPLVESPVALAFDADGRLFVAENRGYPVGPPEGEPPLGRISELLDTNGDGEIDSRRTFAEGLTFPNGLLAYRGGWIVTCAPDVLFLKDADGDGRAEIREVLLTGFSTSGSTQLRVSHPAWGGDNWIYLTGGLTGGRVTSPRHPDGPMVELARADLRFLPDGSRWEKVDGGAQFGQTFDDFGSRFICYNRVQVQQVVAPAATWRRQPLLRFTDTVHNCPVEVVSEPLRGHGAAARLFPLTTHVTTADSHAGTFTAACAVTVFRGDNLPAAFRGAVLSCDPTGNLVHADQLIAAGAVSAALPLLRDHELLASTDPWCRPVFLANAPDGTLYVCDMYRKTIEHPDYLPVEIRKQTDFETGRHSGRIWRVRGAGGDAAQLAARRAPALSGVPATDLVAHLRSANGWHRDTARRLLIERDDRSVLPLLRKVLRDPTAAPEGVAAAVSVAHHWQALQPGDWRNLLTSERAELRALATRLVSEDRELVAGLARLLTALLRDESPRVQFQAAVAVAQLPPGGEPEFESELSTSLAELGLRSGADRWTRAAVLAASAGREASLLTAVLDRLDDETAGGVSKNDVAGSPTSPATPPSAHGGPTGRSSATGSISQGSAAPFLMELGRIAALALPESALVSDSPQWLDAPGDAWRKRVPLWTGLARGLRERGQVPAGTAAWSKLSLTEGGTSAWQTALERATNELRTSLATLGKPASQENAADAQERTGPEGDTLAGVRGRAVDAAPWTLELLEFLAEGPWEVAGPLLRTTAGMDHEEVSLASLRLLAAVPRDEVAGWLLEPDEFARRSPRVRAEILATLLAQSTHARGLLTAIEGRTILPTAVDAFRRRQLLQHPDATVKARATALFGQPEGDRAAVYDAWKEVADLPGHSGRGREVFARVCANCHRLDRVGHAVGPDLFGVRNQPKASLLLHILVPDHEITEGFAAFSVVTTEGRVLSGLVTGSTPEQVTLRLPQGVEQTLPRASLQEFSAAGVSLMPTGLERDLTQTQMADLLSFLKGERAPE